MTGLVHPPSRGAPAPAGLAPVLDRSATFRLDEAAEVALATGEGADEADIYGRFGTPTTREAARLLAHLESAESAALFASGTAAVAASLQVLVPPGGRLLAARLLYGGTEGLLQHETRTRGVDCVRFDATDPGSLDAALSKGADLVWIEAMANPLLEVSALGQIATRCRAAGIPLAVDNTFAAAMAVRPLERGASLVVHSATKFLNGHSDVVAGVACGDRALVRELWRHMVLTGACIDPGAAWLLARGVRTLPLRWNRQCETAARLALALQEHPAVDAVHHPSLPGHPSHALAREELESFGAMLSFTVRGGGPAAERLLRSVRLCAHATSLGGIETLICSPARSSHARMAPQQREALGITDGLVRLSVGLEDFPDLWRDLEVALESSQ